MQINFMILTFFYFFSIVCVTGYGFLFKRILLNNKIQINFGFTGLIGIFFLTIYSYVSHFFFAHTLIHNSIIFSLGIFLFIIFIKLNFRSIDFKILSLVFIILLIAFYCFKTHDDFPYYHFPYTNFLTKSDLIIGLGNYDHGWRTPSSIFYFNSLFYLPFVKYYLFHIGAILIMGFSIATISFESYKKFLSRQIDTAFYFKILSIIFIFIFFYRISEHGTDRSAQILSFLLILEILTFIMKQQNFENFFTKFLILISLIVSLKSFYFIYIIFIIPVYYFIYKEAKIYRTLDILKNNFFYFSILLIFLVIITNIFNTGCLIYPLKFSCFNNIIWSIPQYEIEKMLIHYENWSKAGATTGFKFKVDNPQEYISNFNWVSGWIERYFFNKVSDFLLGLLLIILIFLILFGFQNKKSKNKFNFNLLYLALFILSLEWFYNHPSLRYGGYSLIAISIFLPFSVFLSQRTIDKKFPFKISILIFITILIFFYRNFDRLKLEYNQYNYSIFNNAFYFIDDHHFRVEQDFKSLIDLYKNCNQKNIKCKSYNGLSAYKNYGKFVFVRKTKKD